MKYTVPSLLIALTGFGGAAASGASDLLTLADAVETAVNNNLSLSMADADLAVADARAGEARSGRLPQIGVDGAYARTDNPVLVFGSKLNQGNFTSEDFDVGSLNDPDPINNFSARLTIDQPIYDGGRAGSDIAAARFDREAMAAGRERTRQQVVGETIAAFSGAVLAERRLQVARQSLDAAQANLRLVSDLHDTGLVVASDLLQAQVRETEVREMLVRAESAVEVDRARLNLVLGRELDVPFTLPGSLNPTPRDEEDLQALIRQALDRRPDLRALDQGAQAAERRVRQSRSATYPDVGVSGFFEGHSDEAFGSYASNWGVFATVRFTVFDGKATRGKVRQAMEKERRARYARDRRSQEIDLEVRRSFHDLRAAGQRVGHASRAVALAEESLRIVRDRYGEGLTTLVELLDGEVSLTRARTREVEARRDVLVAGAALDLAVGRL